MSAFADIQTKLLAALVATPALASGNVSLNRLRPIPATQNTAIVLRLTNTRANQEIIGSLDWLTTYAVECYARAAAGGEPSAAIDALLVDVWSRLAAINYATLGASIDIDPAIEWQFDDVDTPVACATFHLTAHHGTDSTTLNTPT